MTRFPLYVKEHRGHTEEPQRGLEARRWDEKTGLLAGCDTRPMMDVLEAQKEAGDAEDQH